MDKSIGKSMKGCDTPVGTIDRLIGKSRTDWCSSPVEADEIVPRVPAVSSVA